ncbi:hypothetical protein NDU88_000157 [Pleurodeles waltl]|uniref:Uncharacterized protein n=1 Tax=Pleurodeles waltl TaxID=8319 RepID=A0AAV7S6T0_PLEWA|nr:hypothetical protein NDU88_000157 [Pleurodeles waltl]
METCTAVAYAVHMFKWKRGLGKTGEYLRGTRRSLLPLDTPVLEKEQRQDEGQRDGDPKAAVEKRSPGESEVATKNRETEVGEHTRQTVDALKSQTRGRTLKEATDLESREDEDRPGERGGGG